MSHTRALETTNMVAGRLRAVDAVAVSDPTEEP